MCSLRQAAILSSIRNRSVSAKATSAMRRVTDFVGTSGREPAYVSVERHRDWAWADKDTPQDLKCNVQGSQAKVFECSYRSPQRAICVQVHGQRRGMETRRSKLLEIRKSWAIHSLSRARSLCCSQTRASSSASVYDNERPLAIADSNTIAFSALLACCDASCPRRLRPRRLGAGWLARLALRPPQKTSRRYRQSSFNTHRPAVTSSVL